MLATRIKICCIASVEEGLAAVEHGAWPVGLVSEMPSGPGAISEALIAEIAAALPSSVMTFMLTSRQDAAENIAEQRRCRVTTVQICDRLRVGTYGDLREGMPNVSIVQVVHVRDGRAIVEAEEVAPHMDAILLDSGDAASPTKRLRGTGQTHNWAVSRQICDRAGVPVFLAGGLTPENVADAVRRVRPFGVALGSGTPCLPPDPDYPGHVEVRRERTGGEIKSQVRFLFLSEPLAGELVGIEPIDHWIWSIVFTTTLLARFDERKRLIVE
jgi:phosphoribosylanthranilate isomerase